MAIPTPEKLIEAGAHVGHKKSRWNPKMAPYVFGVRNNFHIIDVFKTVEKLTEAIEFLKESIRSGKAVILVGTKVQTRPLVKSIAQNLGFSYITTRWIGGLFTNFKVVRQRIRHMRDLREKRSEGELVKYTKKEQLRFSRELEKLESELGGIEGLESLPGILFVSDVNHEQIAIQEAKAVGIPVVALVDTDGDPTAVDYPIPVNDSATKSLEIVFTALQEELAGVKASLPQENTQKSRATRELEEQSSEEGEGDLSPSKGRTFIAPRKATNS